MRSVRSNQFSVKMTFMPVQIFYSGSGSVVWKTMSVQYWFFMHSDCSLSHTHTHTHSLQLEVEPNCFQRSDFNTSVEEFSIYCFQNYLAPCGEQPTVVMCAAILLHHEHFVPRFTGRLATPSIPTTKSSTSYPIEPMYSPLKPALYTALQMMSLVTSVLNIRTAALLGLTYGDFFCRSTSLVSILAAPVIRCVLRYPAMLQLGNTNFSLFSLQWWQLLPLSRGHLPS